MVSWPWHLSVRPTHVPVRNGQIALMLRARRAEPGQAMVEFTFAFFLFVMVLFGLIQVVLLYQAQTALNQAASNASFALSAQSSDGNPDGVAGDADVSALVAIRVALTGLNLHDIASIEVFSADASDNVKAVPVTQSADLNNGPFASATCVGTGSHCIMLDNMYGVMPGPGQSCPVDQFYLQDPLTPTYGTPDHGTPYWNSCSLPWNGRQWDPQKNQNGRHDQRCDEDLVGVKIVYHLHTALIPGNWILQLAAQAITPLEPRQFLGNSAMLQQVIGQC